MILGILGKAGSGKDTVADMFVNNGYVSMAFADPIKRFCMEIFDFSEEQLWGPSEKRSEPDLRYPIDGTNDYLTVRKTLQLIGTQGARAAYDSVWVDYTLKKAKELISNPYLVYDKVNGFNIDTCYYKKKGVIISDGRFINEINGIKSAGGKVIKVVRNGSGLKNEFANHVSETEQDLISDDVFDYIIYNNSSLQDLRDEIDKILLDIS